MRQGFEARARVSANFNGQEKRVLKQTKVNKTKHKSSQTTSRGNSKNKTINKGETKLQ